jgi:hypothetical protein
MGAEAIAAHPMPGGDPGVQQIAKILVPALPLAPKLRQSQKLRPGGGDRSPDAASGGARDLDLDVFHPPPILRNRDDGVKLLRVRHREGDQVHLWRERLAKRRQRMPDRIRQSDQDRLAGVN